MLNPEALLLNTFLPLGVGALITWLVSRHHYTRAGTELEKEAKNLKKLSTLILRWLEHKGENIEILRNEHGNPVALRHDMDFTDAIGAKASLEGLRLEPTESEPPDRQS